MLVDPTGSFDIEVRRTQCDFGVKYDIGNIERDGGREEESAAGSKRGMHK